MQLEVIVLSMTLSASHIIVEEIGSPLFALVAPVRSALQSVNELSHRVISSRLKSVFWTIATPCFICLSFSCRFAAVPVIIVPFACLNFSQALAVDQMASHLTLWRTESGQPNYCLQPQTIMMGAPRFETVHCAFLFFFFVEKCNWTQIWGSDLFAEHPGFVKHA